MMKQSKGGNFGSPDNKLRQTNITMGASQYKSPMNDKSNTKGMLQSGHDFGELDFDDLRVS